MSTNEIIPIGGNPDLYDAIEIKNVVKRDIIIAKGNGDIVGDVKTEQTYVVEEINYNTILDNLINDVQTEHKKSKFSDKELLVDIDYILNFDISELDIITKKITNTFYENNSIKNAFGNLNNVEVLKKIMYDLSVKKTQLLNNYSAFRITKPNKTIDKLTVSIKQPGKDQHEEHEIFPEQIDNSKLLQNLKLGFDILLYLLALLEVLRIISKQVADYMTNVYTKQIQEHDQYIALSELAKAINTALEKATSMLDLNLLEQLVSYYDNIIKVMSTINNIKMPSLDFSDIDDILGSMCSYMYEVIINEILGVKNFWESIEKIGTSIGSTTKEIIDNFDVIGGRLPLTPSADLQIDNSITIEFNKLPGNLEKMQTINRILNIEKESTPFETNPLDSVV